MPPLLQLLILLLAWLAVTVVAYLVAPVALIVPIVLPVLYWFFVLRDSDQRAAVAQEKLKSTLMQHETVVVSGLQLRIGALLSRRLLVALTNSRAIVISRALLGGFSMKDYQWKDVSDARLRENIFPGVFGSHLTLSGQGSSPVSIDALASGIAARMYAHAQAEEQAWEEKRRVRTLEETRAASGGVIVGSPSIGGGGGAPGVSMLEALDRARKLFDSGAISDAEYQELKSKILNGQAF